MEQFLSTIFPCCFPNRHARSQAGRASDAHERTPLLGDGSGSVHNSSPNSISDGGAATPGSDTRRLKRKPTSILPSPAYDATVLRSIIDDFKGKLIAVDTSTGSGEKSGTPLLSSGTDIVVEPKEGEETVRSSNSSTASSRKHVTPVHTLRLTVSTPSSPSSSSRTLTTTTPHPKLVDIWSEPPPTDSPTAVLSYSAAVKKGKKGTPKSGRRFGGTPRPFASASADVRAGTPPRDDDASVEQRTYESLAEIVRSKPLVHDWDLEDASEAQAAA